MSLYLCNNTLMSGSNVEGKLHKDESESSRELSCNVNSSAIALVTCKHLN